MKRLLLAGMMVASVALSASAAALTAEEQELLNRLPSVFATSAEQYKGLLARLAPVATEARPFPKRWERGELVMIKPEDWCSGFFPGCLWLLYEYTGDGFWKGEAEKFTAIQERIRHYTGNHDIGFMLMTSVGNALRLAPKPEYRDILLDGASSLVKRYDEKLGLIRSWGKIGETKDFLVIIDNMMNLELLEWAGKNGGGDKFLAVAKRHADNTNLHHFRHDNSAFHVINYNQLTGKILEYRAGQGASADGTWSRGQAWAIYGFTMMHRETGDPAYLDRAMKAADYVLADKQMPADGVPYWDFHAAWIPNEQRDSSAAAITASALLELSGFAPGEKGKAYRAFAVKQLRSLTSPAYLASVGENGNFLIMHGTGHRPSFDVDPKHLRGEVDVPLNYGDYYFLEALTRFRRLAAAK